MNTEPDDLSNEEAVAERTRAFLQSTLDDLRKTNPLNPIVVSLIVSLANSESIEVIRKLHRSGESEKATEAASMFANTFGFCWESFRGLILNVAPEALLLVDQSFKHGVDLASSSEFEEMLEEAKNAKPSS